MVSRFILLMLCVPAETGHRHVKLSPVILVCRNLCKGWDYSSATFTCQHYTVMGMVCA